MAVPVHTIQEILIQCGVPEDGVLFNGQTKPQRVAMEFFDGDFNACMDLSFADVDQECKTLSTLTVNQGQIRLTPSTKRNIKAFIQWTRDKIILGINPAMVPFPVGQATMYIRRYKLHKQYIDKSKTISDAAKPEKLTEATKWRDWYPSFINFLRAIPGVNGVPLSYIVRDQTEPAPQEDINIDYLGNYVLMAGLNGESFDADNLEVHTYITHFVSGNAIAEAKIVAHGHQNNGRADYMALKNHFEGVGVNALEITKAESIINNLYYVGEKPPHMWWSEFEKELSRAFAVYQRVEGREVHSNSMKLRILMSKVRADFLQSAKAALNIEMSRDPMTLTYEEALSTFRNAVNLKHPPRDNTTNNRVRRVNEVGRGGRYGRGNGRGGRAAGGRAYYRGGYNANGGRGRFNNRGGRGRGAGNNMRRKTKPDSWWAVCDSGRVVECHPKISYPNQVWYEIPREDKQRIMQLRELERNNQSSNTTIVSELSHATTTINGQSYRLVPTNPTHQIQQTNTQLPPPPNNTPVNPPPPTQVTIMGGRNEQSILRTRNQNN